MGLPEPIVARLPSLMQKASEKEIYIFPTFVSGGESIFPNVPGTNELDNFMQNLQIGHGNMYCGKPIPLSKIAGTISRIDKAELVKATLGEVPSSQEYLCLSALSIVILGSIASLCPSLESRGIYNNPHIDNALEIMNN